VEKPYAIVAAIGVVLAAVYLLWVFQRTFMGRPTGDNATMKDIGFRELACVVPLLGLSLFLGIYPKPVLDIIEPDVKEVICQVALGSDYLQPTGDDRGCTRGTQISSAVEK
jgi:NADH-quinone oxidoreductase subunit M